MKHDTIKELQKISDTVDLITLPTLMKVGFLATLSFLLGSLVCESIGRSTLSAVCAGNSIVAGLLVVYSVWKLKTVRARVAKRDAEES